MTKYIFICIRFIIDKNIKIYKNKKTNKMYCKNKINTKDGKKTCMISLKNYKKKKLILLEKKKGIKQSSKFSRHNTNKSVLLKHSKKFKNKKKKGGFGTISYFTHLINNKIEVQMYDNNVEQGHFNLSIGMRPYDLGIGLEDSYQGHGFSKQLLREFYYFFLRHGNGQDGNGNNLYKFKKNGVPGYEIINDSEILAIDTDASGNNRGPSFWQYLGMVDNRYYDKTILAELHGYEKTITLKQLLINIYKLCINKKK